MDFSGEAGSAPPPFRPRNGQVRPFVRPATCQHHNTIRFVRKGRNGWSETDTSNNHVRLTQSQALSETADLVTGELAIGENDISVAQTCGGHESKVFALESWNYARKARVVELVNRIVH